MVGAYGAKFIASYHMIESDNLGYDYGDELDLLLTKTFKKHYTLGAKIGIYDADTNATNVARNPKARLLMSPRPGSGLRLSFNP